MEKSYEKVVDFVQNQILNGVYSTGDKLPSEREMALQLNVSRTSVREGIRILEQMGALSCQQGSGNYIAGDFEGTLIRVMTLMFAVEGTTYRKSANSVLRLNIRRCRWQCIMQRKNRWRRWNII